MCKNWVIKVGLGYNSLTMGFIMGFMRGRRVRGRDRGLMGVSVKRSPPKIGSKDRQGPTVGRPQPHDDPWYGVGYVPSVSPVFVEFRNTDRLTPPWFDSKTQVGENVTQTVGGPQNEKIDFFTCRQRYHSRTGGGTDPG